MVPISSHWYPVRLPERRGSILSKSREKEETRESVREGREKKKSLLLPGKIGVL